MYLYVVTIKQTIKMKIYPNDCVYDLIKTTSKQFKFVEQRFHEWLAHSNPASEYNDMYFSEDAIYDKRDAIVGVLEAASEEAQESGSPVDLSTFDVAGHFE